VRWAITVSGAVAFSFCFTWLAGPALSLQHLTSRRDGYFASDMRVSTLGKLPIFSGKLSGIVHEDKKLTWTKPFDFHAKLIWVDSWCKKPQVNYPGLLRRVHSEKTIGISLHQG
jgi:hypothetical protein